MIIALLVLPISFSWAADGGDCARSLLQVDSKPAFHPKPEVDSTEKTSGNVNDKTAHSSLMQRLGWTPPSYASYPPFPNDWHKHLFTSRTLHTQDVVFFFFLTFLACVRVIYEFSDHTISWNSFLKPLYDTSNSEKCQKAEEAAMATSMKDNFDQNQDEVVRDVHAEKQAVTCDLTHLLPKDGKLWEYYAVSNLERPALYDAEATKPPLSHGALREFVNSQAHSLQQMLGDGQGLKLALFVSQGPEAMLAFLVCFAAQVSLTVPIDPKYTGDELRRIFSEPALGLQAVLTSAEKPGELVQSIAGELNMRLVLMSRSVSPTSPVGCFSLKLASAGSFTPTTPHTSCGGVPAIALSTSGTCGKPKFVEQPVSNILMGAKLIAGSLHLTQLDHELGVMPLHHIGGICTGLAALVSGGAMTYADVFSPKSFCNHLSGIAGHKEQMPTWYYAVPSIHHDVAVAVEKDDPGHALRLVRSGAAALPPAVNERLRAALGCPVLPTCSMTECMPVCGTPLHSSLPFTSVGFPIGPCLKIADANGHAVEHGATGEVLIFQPGLVTPGYIGLDRKISFTDDGWLRTGDLGHMGKDGCVELIGRSKEVINRAGETLAPAVVEDALLRLSAVSDAMAFAVPSEEFGEVVGAAVVLKDGERDQLAITDMWKGLEPLASRQLWPEVVIYMKEIPKGRTGKKQRLHLAAALKNQGLTDKIQIPAAFDGDYKRVSEGNEIFTFLPRSTGLPSGERCDHSTAEGEGELGRDAQLARLWLESLDLPKQRKIDWDASFWAQGGRSTQLAALIAQTRDAFNLPSEKLPLSAIMAQPNFRGLVAAVDAAQGVKAAALGSIHKDLDTSKLLVPLGKAMTEGATEGCPIVITITGRQSPANRMGPVALLLPETRCFGLEKAGRGVREDERLEDFDPETAPAMALEFAQAILESFGQKRPVILFATSMGGGWAYAVAVELQRLGGTLARLVLMDAPSPLIDLMPYRKEAEHLKRFFSQDPSQEEISSFFKRTVTRKMPKGTMGEDKPGWEERVLRCFIWDADAYCKLLEHYAPRTGMLPSQLNCPIAVFRATQDPELFLKLRNDREWMKFTSTGPFEYFEMPLSHEMFLERVIMQAEKDSELKARLTKLCAPEAEEEGTSLSDCVCPWQGMACLKPDNLSLVDEHQCMVTCQQLADSAATLSASMCKEGVSKSSRVLVIGLVGRECLITQLALMHIGSAAVLVGPGETSEYLAQVAEMASCSHAISLVSDCDVTSIPAALHELTFSISPNAHSFSSPAFVQRTAPASILFSSGSTGKPKGVLQSFGALLNLVADMAPSTEPLLWKGSIGWIANFALPYVLAGQPLLTVTRETQLNPLAFKDLRCRHGVKTLTMAPSELRAQMETPQCLSDLESITCMAEALPQSVALEFFSQYSNVKLLETYASSEVQGSNAFLSTEVSRDGVAGKFNVRPTQIAYLVDPEDHTKRISVSNQVGELLLKPTASGYLDNKQTSARFIPNPFGPGQLFRTGDLCKWLTVGKRLQLTGRVDFQVKVSGKLVELEHVEHAAEALPGVGQAAARTYVRSSGAMVIALYISNSIGNAQRSKNSVEDVSEAQLDKQVTDQGWVKEQLGKVLPSHAVPAIVVFLDEIPLLKNGKKDRKSLPEPEEDDEQVLVTDSIGMVKAVAARTSQEFHCKEALVGLVCVCLPLRHFLVKTEMWKTLFGDIVDGLDMKILFMVLGYFDGRRERDERAWAVHVGSIIFVYLMMGMPVLYDLANFRCTFQRWSCGVYALYLVANRMLTFCKISIPLAVLSLYVLAPYFYGVDISASAHLYQTHPVVACLVTQPYFPMRLDDIVKNAGHYIAFVYIATLVPTSTMQRILGRPRVAAVLAGLAWLVLAVWHKKLRADYAQPERYSPLGLYLAILGSEWLALFVLVLCVGEGFSLLRLVGKNVVGTYLLHLFFPLKFFAVAAVTAPAGVAVQAVLVTSLSIIYTLTFGSVANTLVIRLSLSLQSGLKWTSSRP